MTSHSHRQYLSSSDMALIEQVLADAGFVKGVPSEKGRDAAKFLTRKFQDGVVDGAGLAKALKGHLVALEFQHRRRSARW